MLAFAVENDPNSARIARVRDFNVKTLVTGHKFDEVDISDPRLSATGANNTVSYQPRYRDTTDFGHGGSDTTAAFFINMRKVFPCTRSLSYRYHPVCKIFTNEEDGFRSYRPIIEAADSIWKSLLHLQYYFKHPHLWVWNSRMCRIHNGLSSNTPLFVIVCYLGQTKLIICFTDPTGHCSQLLEK